MALTLAAADLFSCPVCGSGLGLVDGEDAMRCEACGHAIAAVDGVLDLVPEARRGPERAFYDDFYERAQAAQRPDSLEALAGTWTAPGAPWEMQRVWNRLGDLRGLTVLLLGNGESHAELYMLTKEPRVLIYSDLSPVGLRELRGDGELARDGSVLFAAIDALDLPLRDESIDLVYGFAFAHHLPDPERFLAEVARVLRPGGRCVFMDNAYSPIWQWLKLGSLRPLMGLSHRREPRSPEDIRDTMSGGFREERLSEAIRRVGGEPWFERVAFLYYFWKRASVALFPKVLRVIPRHDLVSTALMRIDRFLSRFRWVRRNTIRLIWGFDKLSRSGERR
jgi:SAM-dependent methyltransferase